jgi:hypothetical protein
MDIFIGMPACAETPKFKIGPILSLTLNHLKLNTDRLAKLSTINKLQLEL